MVLGSLLRIFLHNSLPIEPPAPVIKIVLFFIFLSSNLGSALIIFLPKISSIEILLNNLPS